MQQNEAEPRPAHSHEEEPYPSPVYAWYVVGVLMIVYVLSFVDRQILSLIVGPVKKDLGVNDTQMGLLMGFSFAMFYSILGVPFGWLADQKSRRSIIAVGVAVWSFMTAACVIARQFWQLFLLRVGVGIGEAALSPAAYSLITDYFPRHRLATAISVYGMGIYIGSGLAFLLGGVVVGFTAKSGPIMWPIFGEIRPWQLVFFVVGAPGLLIAALVYTIREPLRRGMKSLGPNSQVSFPQFMRYVNQNAAAVWCHHLGFALLAFLGYATISWVAEFFKRVHGWTVQDIAFSYGFAIMIFGAAGITSGGMLADWLSRKGYRDAKVRTGLIAALLSLPLSIAFPLIPNGTLAMAMVCPLAFANALPFGAAPAAMQEMMPANMRGQAGAFYLLVVNLISIGCAATTVGFLNDKIFPEPTGIAKSLIVVGVVSTVGAAIFLYCGLKPFVRSLDRLKQSEGR
ncbi:MAG: MFS transporter [Candidatus Hydrogenedentes bacterium]|nr:MFS transporter [Candidatus Hydrogenedentota bacterium]